MLELDDVLDEVVVDCVEEVEETAEEVEECVVDLGVEFAVVDSFGSSSSSFSLFSDCGSTGIGALLPPLVPPSVVAPSVAGGASQTPNGIPKNLTHGR